MQIRTFIAMHGRHDVVRLFAKYQKFPVVCVASTKEDINLAKSFGWDVVKYSNTSLSEKLQYGLEFARTLPHDGLLMLGSDDLVSPQLYEDYIKYIRLYEFVAVKHCYFIDINTGMTRFWRGYKTKRKGEPCGAGRLYRKDLLERIDYKLWNNPSLDKGVDSKSWDTIKKTNNIKLINLDYNRVLVDLKDAESTTSMDRFSNDPIISNAPVLKLFPDIVKRPC